MSNFVVGIFTGILLTVLMDSFIHIKKIQLDVKKIKNN